MAFLLLSAFLALSSAHAESCAVLKSSRPGCFEERRDPVVRAIMVHYGSAVGVADLRRVGALLVRRFKESTAGALELEIAEHRVIPLRPRARDLDEIAARIPGPPEKKDPARLVRLWYYYHSPASIADEVREEMAKAPGLKKVMKRVDAVLVMAEPQFEGLGYADGAYAITEQPVEIAWAGEGGGFTRFESDARVVDELLHELGHVLGLDHAAKQCNAAEVEGRKCCELSPGGQDVMSYCRVRSSVTESFYYGFTACTRDFLAGATRAALLGGGRRVRQAAACE
jgi:hypothetical protein